MNPLVEVVPPPSPVAIVGSRDYKDLEAVRRFVRSLPEDACIVSGGARGVDQAAEDEANRIGRAYTSYRPTKLYGWRIVQVTKVPGYSERERILTPTYPTFAKAAFTRNQMIVNEAASVAAFWDGQSRGTLDTINKAKAAGILYQVFTDQEDSKDAIV